MESIDFEDEVIDFLDEAISEISNNNEFSDNEVTITQIKRRRNNYENFYYKYPYLNSILPLHKPKCLFCMLDDPKYENDCECKEINKTVDYIYDFDEIIKTNFTQILTLSSPNTNPKSHLEEIEDYRHQEFVVEEEDFSTIEDGLV